MKLAIELKPVKNLHSILEHAQQSILGYSALGEVKQLKQRNNVLLDCGLISRFFPALPNDIDPRAHETARSASHHWLPVTQAVPHNELTLGNGQRPWMPHSNAFIA